MDQRFIDAIFGAIQDSPTVASVIVERLAYARDIQTLQTILDNDLLDLSVVQPTSPGHLGTHQAILNLLRTGCADKTAAKGLVLRWLGKAKDGLQNALDALLVYAHEPEDIRSLIDLGANPNRVRQISINPSVELTAFGYAFYEGSGRTLATLLMYPPARNFLPMYDAVQTVFEKAADRDLLPPIGECVTQALALVAEAEIPNDWQIAIADTLESVTAHLTTAAVAAEEMDRYLLLMALARPTAGQWEKILRGRDEESFFANALVFKREETGYAERTLRNMKAVGVDLDAPICTTISLDELPLLHKAASNNNSKIVGFLLELGADPSVTVTWPGQKSMSAQDLAPPNSDTAALMMAWSARRVMTTATATFEQEEEWP